MGLSKKKNVLMICSWLDHELGLGSFFIDQALMLSGNFNFILIHFRPVKITSKNIREYSKLFTIEKFVYQNKVTILYLNYPTISIFKKDLFDKLFKRYSLKIVNKYLKKEGIEIDLSHAQSLFDASFWAYEFHRRYKIPYVLTEHNQFTLRNVDEEKLIKLDKVLNRSKFNLVVSNDLIRQFASNGFFHKFINVGNSVDEQLFKYKKKEPNDGFEIITMGAYTPIKDPDTLLKAIKILDDLNYKNITFTWIGINSWGADFSDEVDKLISGFEFKNIKITVIPKASKTEIISALQKSDVFLYTSLCETFGVSALEALSVGVPVITTQSGGVNEMINEGNGKIVPIKDFEGLAQNILKIMKKELHFDNELLSKQIIDKFGTEAFSKKLSTIYNEVIIN